MLLFKISYLSDKKSHAFSDVKKFMTLRTLCTLSVFSRKCTNTQKKLLNTLLIIIAFNIFAGIFLRNLSTLFC